VASTAEHRLCFALWRTGSCEHLTHRLTGLPPPAIFAAAQSELSNFRDAAFFTSFFPVTAGWDGMQLSTCHHTSGLPLAISDSRARAGPGNGSLPRCSGRREQATQRTGRRTTRPFSAKQLHPVRVWLGRCDGSLADGASHDALLQEEVRLDARDDGSQPAAGHPSRCNARPGGSGS